MNRIPTTPAERRSPHPDSQAAADHDGTRQRVLSAAREQANEGQFCDALQTLRQAGSLKQWTGADRVEVSWIVRELGAPRLATWHVLKAFREAPEVLACRNAYATEMLDDRGPLETLEFVEAHPGASSEDSALERIHWMWLYAVTHMAVRDFPSAAQWIDRMDQVRERSDLVWLVRANLLERQDRYDDAFDATDQAIALKASRRAIQYKAHLLTLRGRDDEAYAMLQEADARMQVGGFAWQMALIAYERRDYPDCQRLLRRFESLTPLRERSFGDLFLLFRSELARRTGNDEEAIRYARQSRSARGRQIAEMLADPGRISAIDKILPVPFIRQHEMTCGPATLAALSAYWGRPAEHLEVAEEICYAGTTTHAERKWAEDNGFATAEFTVTEVATEALIARDVPFTLVTRGAGYAHLQAVIGFDGRTATVLIRDPYHRTRGAVGIRELLEDQAAHGPRGMVMVPREQANLIVDLQLSDAALYDLLHRFDAALIEHRRERAVGVLRELSALAPDHRITLMAQRQLGLYDSDEAAMLTAVERLLQQFPDDASLQLSHVSLLGSMGRHRQRQDRLRELAARPQAHPMVLLQLGETLSQDGRSWTEAERLIREAIRKGPMHSRGYLELGDLWITMGRRSEALRVYRFAASLEETDELVAMRYFDAAVVTGRSEEVMRWLRDRFERLGSKSQQPAVTLATALLRQRKHHDALAVLDQAIQLRPNDAELKLFIAQTLSEVSSEHWPQAEQLLEQTRAAAPQRLWRQTASHLCELRGELIAAREHLMELLPLNPLSMALRESICGLTAQLEGEDVAIDQWRQASAEFPHFLPLQERYAMALRDRLLDVVRPVLDEIIGHSPDNAWAHRELAFHLLSAGRLDECQDHIERADQLAGEHPFVALVKSSLAHRRGDTAGAKRMLRELIQRDANDESAVTRLLELCLNADQLREELRWLIGQLQESTVTGDVLLIYRDAAAAVLPAEDVLATLQDALAARGDLWSAHQAVIRQLTHMQRLDQATAAAAAATDQFPLEPAAWFERYQVAVAAADREVQRLTLEQSRLLRPGNAIILRALAELDASLGGYQSARELLEELVAKQPLDPVNRAYLGDCLLELGEIPAALAQFERAVRLAPEYEFAWRMLGRVAEQLDDADRYEQVARDLTHSRPHEAAAWLHLSYALADRQQYEQAHQCLDRAERIDPYREVVHLARSRFFLSAGDFDAAMAALSPAVFATIPPSLALQRAQLMWNVGQQDAAYALVVQTAEDDPTFLPAWQRLQQWATTRGDREKAIAAIEHQVAANPHDPDVLDAAGGALADLQANDRAIELLRRAIEIAPGYTGSRCRLFDLLVDQGDWDEAERIVSGLARMDDHPVVIARRLRVADHRGDSETRDAAVGAIVRAVPVNAWALDQATEVMLRLHRGDELAAEINDAAAVLILRAVQASMTDAAQHRSEVTPAVDASDDPNAAGETDSAANTDLAASPVSVEEFTNSLGLLGRKWAELHLTLRDASDADVKTLTNQIRQCLKHPDDIAKTPGRASLTVLVEHLRSQQSIAAFKRFLKQNQEWLRDDASCWGTIAYAMAASPTQFSKSEMWNWIADYRKREITQAWVYTNIHELLRLCGRTDEAIEAVQLALTLPPDAMRSQLALWAAYDCLVSGEPRQALHHFMKAAHLEDLEGTDRLMHVWVEAVLMLGQAPDPQADFAEVRRRLRAIQPPTSFFKSQPVYRPVYVNTLRMISRQVGTAAAKWWAAAKRWKLFLVG